MKYLVRFALALFVAFSALLPVAQAGATDPLFVSLTTDDTHRARMGLSFGKNQLERGHPLTIYLNDKGVLIASKSADPKFAEHQKMLGELMTKGATVLVCPMCMKHYGVKETDLLAGMKVSNPELAGGALFKDNARTLTW